MKKLFSILMVLSLVFTAMPVQAQTTTPVLMYSVQSEINPEDYTLQATVELPDEATLSIEEYYANFLTDYQKKVYRGLVNALTSIEPDSLTLKQRVQVTYNVELPEPITSQEQFDTMVENVRKEENDKFDGQILFNAMKYDHTELFWLHKVAFGVNPTDLIQDGANITLVVTVEMFIDSSELFDSEEELIFATLNMNDAVDEIIVQAPNTSEYDKTVYFNNWLKEYNTYNHPHLEDDSYPLAHTAYSAFVSNNNEPTGPVCQGYAYAFKYLCNLSGIDCVVVTGDLWQHPNSNGSHAWNAVELDGAWYGVDVTSNDSLETDEYNFLVGSTTASSDPTYTTFAESHVADTTHTYPTLSETAYEPKPDPVGEIAIEGATIRVGEKAGLRFRTIVQKNAFFSKYYTANDEDNIYAYSEDNNIVFGTILIPEDLIPQGSTLQEMFEAKNPLVLEIPAKKIFSQDKDSVVFTGVIINIPTNAETYNRSIVAVSYIKYRENEESEWNYVYSEKDDASYLSVAKAARASDYSDANNPNPSEEVKNIMKQLDEIITICVQDLGE